MEILIAVFVLSLLAVILSKTFTSFLSSSSLSQAVQDSLSSLEKAREETLAGKYNLSYGVHFATTSLTVFSGASYDTNAASSTVIAFPSGVSVSFISLNGGGNDVFFIPVSGETTNAGAITLSSSRDGATSTIIIYGTGIAKRQ